jgi:hypothetical protein
VGAAQRADEELAERVVFIESGSLSERFTPVQMVAFQKEMEAYYLRTNDQLLMYLSHDKGKPLCDSQAMIVVPNQLKTVVMQTYHDSTLGGHLGFLKTLQRIKDKYFWTGMLRDVQKYREECKIRHARKNPSRRRRHELGRRPHFPASL